MVSVLDDQLIARARNLSSATLHEAAERSGALPSNIKPLSTAVILCGRALPVLSPPGDNLWLHRAIEEAKTGDVLVVSTGSVTEFGYWGEIMALAAQHRGIAGLVIDGGVRDSQKIIEMRFPVFSAAICIRGTDKDIYGRGSVGEAIRFGDIDVNTGDLVFGDADGVVVLPKGKAAKVVEAGYARDSREMDIMKMIRNGTTTMEIYKLPHAGGAAR